MKVEEKTLESKTVFEGKIITVKHDTVLLPSGKTSKREVVAHNGGVCVAVLTEDDCVYLVSQFRYPYMETVLELPAGKLEKGEDPYQAGIREAHEETGCEANRLFSLGKFYPTPGYCGEIIHLYWTNDYQMKEQKLDEGEFLNVEKIPFDEVLRMVMEGEITDGKTQTAILKLAVMKREGKI